MEATGDTMNSETITSMTKTEVFASEDSARAAGDDCEHVVEWSSFNDLSAESHVCRGCCRELPLDCQMDNDTEHYFCDEDCKHEWLYEGTGDRA